MAKAQNKKDQQTTSFGFQEVDVGEKMGLVRGVFNSVADSYDVMNDVMSAGVHRLWKNSLIDTLKPRPGMRLLDVAGGTGDIAFRFLRAAPGSSVTVCDINGEMLRVGRARATDNGLIARADFAAGNAECLPFQPGQFDAYTIAFGIRNVTHIDKALLEAHRMLRPGGRFLCLEFSPAVLPQLKKAYDIYSFDIIPAMGELVAGDRDSYQYLVESIRQFPAPEQFQAMMKAAGFDHVSARSMSGGIVRLFSGWRI